jgi:protein-S-isoprenylcysteine O-methyltransferase Ste14
MITHEGVILWSWAVFLLVWVLSAFGVKRDIRGAVFTPLPALGWTAAVMTAAGIGVAIWARVFIGSNWSPRPAVKEHHELVTTGPYAYVRHPIYTGMLLATLGTALTGTVFGIGAFAFASFVFLTRIGREEKIMLELFPNEYPAYQTRTKRLVPFLW